MISKTLLLKRSRKKRNPEIVETIELAKKYDLLDLAKKLSGSRKNYKNVNLDELNEKKGDRILVIGKVLGSGEIKRKIGIAAFGFSEQAKDKLKKADCDFKSIKEAIEKNKNLEGVEIIG